MSASAYLSVWAYQVVHYTTLVSISTGRCNDRRSAYAGVRNRASRCSTPCRSVYVLWAHSTKHQIVSVDWVICNRIEDLAACNRAGEKGNHERRNVRWHSGWQSTLSTPLPFGTWHPFLIEALRWRFCWLLWTSLIHSYGIDVGLVPGFDATVGLEVLGKHLTEKVEVWGLSGDLWGWFSTLTDEGLILLIVYCLC